MDADEKRSLTTELNYAIFRVLKASHQQLKDKADDVDETDETDETDEANAVCASAVQTWTEKKNDRRCDLINKEIDSTLTVAEKCEVEQLQREMLAYRQKVAPLPLEEVRALHQHLKSLEEENVVFDSTAQHWTNQDGVPVLPIEAGLKNLTE